MERITALSESNLTHAEGRVARYGVWLFGVGISTLVITGFGLGLLALLASDGTMNPFTHLFFLPFVTSVYGLIGILVARQQPRNIIGWLLLLVALCSAVSLISQTYSKFEAYVLLNSEGTVSNIFAWLDKWVWWIPSIIPLTHLLLLFPDGRLPSSHWRWISWLASIGLVSAIFGTAFHPGPFPEFGLLDPNPYGLPGIDRPLEILLYLSSLALIVGMLGSIASVIHRFRNASGTERIRLKWLAYAALLVTTGLVASFVLWIMDTDNPATIEFGIIVTSLGVTIIIAAIGVAVLRHNLWDVDVLINRTLVYSLLTLILVGMYVLVVSFLSVLFDGDSQIFALVATGFVAVSFQTVRDAVQNRVSRLLFGQRDHPYQVLRDLSSHLEPVVAIHDVLPATASAIADALRLPYVAVMLRHNGHDALAATYPLDAKLPRAAVETIPLVYQTETIGQLILATRSRDEVFTPAERELLQTIARQVAVAAHNVHLTEDLQRSREQIVTAREEERRRLRRDLHDGLGPVLAAMSFRLDEIGNLVEHNPKQARQLTGDLKTQVQSALSEVRRIAYNLRPPALDELGLLGALRQHIESTQQSDGLRYGLDFPAVLPPLPAAVEVAAYRIVLEAVTNVQRHAHAITCSIRIRYDRPRLCLDIIDDGCGVSVGQPAGVGLNAMRERAAELGGQFSILQTAPGGAHIQAWLPCDAQEKA